MLRSSLRRWRLRRLQCQWSAQNTPLSSFHGNAAAAVESSRMSAQAYCLCPRGSNSVRGLAQGPKADEVIVTVQNDGVVCYNSARRVSAIVIAITRN